MSLLKPGFYNVLLNRDKIDVSLTCTERVGVHKYDYSENDTANVIIDLEHRDQLLDLEFRASFINRN